MRMCMIERRRVSAFHLFAAVVFLVSLASTLAVAGETSLSMTSSVGDWVGQGQSYFYTDQDATFTAWFDTIFNNADHVAIAVEGPSFSFWWYLDFGPIHNAQLTAGVYNGATRWPFNGPTEPGVDVGGNGRGCNTLTGTYTVIEIDIDGGGNVVAFHATFEQHCDGLPPVLNGEIKFNATVANPVENVTWGAIKSLYSE